VCIGYIDVLQSFICEDKSVGMWVIISEESWVDWL